MMKTRHDEYIARGKRFSRLVPKWLPRKIRYPILRAHGYYNQLWYYHWDWKIAWNGGRSDSTSRYKRHRAWLLKHQKVCQHCHKEGTKHNPLTIDHIVPRSKGGTNGLWNKQLLCRNCNVRKGNKPNDYRVSDLEKLRKFEASMKDDDSLWKLL